MLCGAGAKDKAVRSRTNASVDFELAIRSLSHSIHGIGRRSDVIDLQNHFDQLGCKQDLRLLAMQALDDVLLPHVCRNEENSYHD